MDRDKESGSREEAEDTVPSGASQLKARLALIGHYVLPALAPILSVVALIFAVMAYNGSRSALAHLGETNSRIDSIKSAQTEPKSDADIFQVSLAREKVLLAEERKRLAEREAVVIRNVSQLQVKLKVVPTLDEQLGDEAKAPAVARPVTGIPAVAASVASAVAVTTPASVSGTSAVEKKPVAATGVSSQTAKDDIKNPSAVAAGSEKAGKMPVTTAKESAKAPAPPPTKATKSDALKKTIEEFNKIDRKK